MYHVTLIIWYMKTIATQESVRSAALQLLARGEMPTWRAVNQILGGGSATTISALLKSVWLEVGQRVARPDLPESVAELAQSLWSEAQDQAEAALAQRRADIEARLQAADEAMAGLRQAQDAARAEARVLHDTLETTRIALHTSESQTAALQTQVEELQQQRATADTRLAQASTEIATLSERLAARETQLTSLQTEQARLVADLDRERQHFDAEQVRTAAEIDGLRQTLQARTQGLESAHKVETELRQQLATRDTAVATAEERLSAAQAEIQRLQRALDIAQSEVSGVRAAHDQERQTLTRQLATLEASASAMAAERDTLKVLLERWPASPLDEENPSEPPFEKRKCVDRSGSPGDR